jgi:hypothetical protein
MHINQLALAKSSIKRKTHFICLRTCCTADFGQVWPENDTHDWPPDEVVTQWTMAKCGKNNIMPLIGGLCLTTADFDQIWSKLCPSLEGIVTQWTSTKCGLNCAPHWRSLSCNGLQPNVPKLCPSLEDFVMRQTSTKCGPNRPSLEDFVTQRTLTKCGPKCASHQRTLTHCGL